MAKFYEEYNWLVFFLREITKENITIIVPKVWIFVKDSFNNIIAEIIATIGSKYNNREVFVEPI